LSGKTVTTAISNYGASVKPKLTSIAIDGAPEDQLRGPLDVLVQDLAAIAGLPGGSVHLVGETSLADLKTRPDFAVTVSKALVGFIEVKAPGKGADPRQFDDPHDRDQWNKLKSLPNLIYTDGNSFSLWRDGKIEGAIIHLDGNVETSGAKLAAPATLLPLISDFLRWKPIPPKSAQKLAEVTARLCRLLRDEVIEQMAIGNPGLTALATDWRKLLFPQADDAQFADGYAQAVTFGLLVARARDISLSNGEERAADYGRHRQSTLQGEGRGARRLDRGRLGRKIDRAARSMEAASGMGCRCAREASQESLYLFLALGDLESVWFRKLRCDGFSRQGRGRHRLFHYCRRFP
jgi:hypothetical protein